MFQGLTVDRTDERAKNLLGKKVSVNGSDVTFTVTEADRKLVRGIADGTPITKHVDQVVFAGV